ncbi:WD40-repeat-containing domain protein, partial [Sporodiniella umbellata]
MPQLSFLFNTTKPLLRIDFVSVLPKEITLQIFSYLDAKTLCHAAGVSHTWRKLADEDALLDKKAKLSIQQRETQLSPMQIACGPSSHTGSIRKRKATELTPTELVPKKRPWKEVYSERLTIEKNWRSKRYKVLNLKGHTNGVMCIQFCEITKRVITGSLDKTVRVWSLETGELIRTLTGHTREVRALQFDDAKLVTGAMDNALKIWNYHTGQCIRTLEGHTGGVLSLHFDSRIMASGSTDHTIRVWNFDLGECYTLIGHTQWVNSVRICLEGKMLISSSDDASIRLWDLSLRACTRVFQGHVGQVQVALPSPLGFKHNLGSTPDSPIIISSSLDNTIKIWDLQSGKSLRTLFGHIQGIWGLDFDKLHIVSGSHDKTLRIWEAETGKCLYALEGHHGPVTAVKLSDTKIVSASDDGEVKIWDFGLI